MRASSSSYTKGFPFEALFATRPDNKDAKGLPCASLLAAARGALFGPIPVAQVRVALPRVEAAS
jgi:hypothetical protein